jgi:formylglycine-generating enzyme required for sulfatase activity
MHGNLFECCQDWYDKDYYAKSPTDDPAGPPGGSFRVLRGGCWGHWQSYCRSAYRATLSYVVPPVFVGFRASLVLPDK